MVFGKNIESPEKYSKYLLKLGEDAVDYYNNKQEQYKDFIYIDEQEPIILFDKKVILINLDKPTIVGFCIFEISKHIMAQYYCRLKQLFKENMKLLYTDTDSVIIEITNMNEQKTLDYMKQNDPEEKFFELPGYKEKKVPGRIALEKTCKYFKAFAAKHYIVDREEKCKGVPKHCTTIDKLDIRGYYHIQSKNHTVSIQKVERKIKYSDDKKIYLVNGEVLNYGYKGEFGLNRKPEIKKDGRYI
jgi:predicted ribosome-associated RNA-binding protein Tma20